MCRCFAATAVQVPAQQLRAVRGLQAAAERKHGVFHPALTGGPSVRENLRVLCTVQRNIVDGTSVTRPPMHGPLGCLSPDFSRHAMLSLGGKLHVRDVSSGRLLHEWDLPQVPAAFCPAAGWGWDQTSQYLKLLWGKPWCRAWKPAPHSGNTAGMVHVDTWSGRTATVSLQLGGKSGQGWATAYFCPGSSLVLAHYGDWDEEDAAASIFDHNGCLLHSTEKVIGQQMPLWARGGQAVVFRLGDHQTWSFWDLNTGSLEWIKSSEESVLAWATPYTGQAALLLKPGIEVDTPGSSKLPILVLTLPSSSENPSCCQLVWGSRLCLLADWRKMQLYSITGANALALQQIVQPKYGRHFIFSFNHLLSLAADGSMCAALTGTPVAHKLVRRHLAVVHLASGTLREYPLQDRQLGEVLEPDDLMVSWSRDCSAVLVSSRDGSHNEVLRFC